MTVALGVAFMGGQAHEYMKLFEGGLHVSSSLFASTFFTLTGFHGLHVTLGIFALAILTRLAFGAGFKERSSNALKAVGVYWHFVDIVWIAVFSIVYVRGAQ